MESGLGLYVHFPFCLHKCGYCDFNSRADTSRVSQLKWFEVFERQLDHWSARLARPELRTVFFGGGTPSLLEDDLLVKSGELVRRYFPLALTAEWTVECNPETLNPAKLEALAAMGANRLSIGVQSFDDGFLERLERRARRGDNLRALELVATTWRGRWSLDLMFGLPDQDLALWQSDLEFALKFGSKHLSAYQLTLTTERSKNWSQPPEDALLKLFDYTEERLGAHGLAKYEVSNFAAAGEESRHNLRYWKLESFLGLGPGASGLLLDAAPGAFVGAPKSTHGYHQRQPDRFETWSEGAGTESVETARLTPRTAFDHLEETLLMGLRLKEGIELLRLGPWAAAAGTLVNRPSYAPFFRPVDSRIALSERGERVLDSLLPALYRDLEKSGPSP